jgi:hypothetical protein
MFPKIIKNAVQNYQLKQQDKQQDKQALHHAKRGAATNLGNIGNVDVKALDKATNDIDQVLRNTRDGKVLYQRGRNNNERLTRHAASPWSRFKSGTTNGTHRTRARGTLDRLAETHLKLAQSGQYNRQYHALAEKLDSLLRNLPLETAFTVTTEIRQAVHEINEFVKNSGRDIQDPAPAVTETALPNPVEETLRQSTDALVQSKVRTNVQVEQPDPEPNKPAMQDLNSMKILQRGLAISRMSADEKRKQNINLSWDRECQRLAAEVDRMLNTSSGHDFAESTARQLMSQIGPHNVLMHTGILGYLKKPEARHAFLKGLGGEPLAKAVLAETT